MDVLSSQATVAGYRAVLLAAKALPRMFPMMMTAAGTITPAQGVCGRGRRRRLAGHRHVGPPGRHRLGLRRAAGGQGAGAEPGAKFVEMPLETATAETKGGYAQEMNEEFYRKQRELMTRVVAENES